MDITLSHDELAIILEALEMWTGNECDDIHEMGDDEPNKAERRARAHKATVLFNALAQKGGFRS